jgi:hypothetical protein
MGKTIQEDYLTDVISRFHAYKELAEGAFAQVSDEEFFARLDNESNSIAVLVKHISGNSMSRWKDFLTSDGEKPERNRDQEFEMEAGATRDELLSFWESGWQTLFNAIEPLNEADLDRRVLIRGEEHPVVAAINRQMMHYAYHIGQIVFLAKHFRAMEWQSLSIPRNKSAEFNRYLGSKLQQTGSLDHSMEEAAKFAFDSRKK